MPYAGLVRSGTYEIQVLALRKLHGRYPKRLRLLRLALDQSWHGDHQAAIHALGRATRAPLVGPEANRIRGAAHRVRAVVYLSAGQLMQAEREIARAINMHLPDDVPGCVRCRIVAAEIYLAMGQADEARGQLLVVLDNLHHLDIREILQVGRLDMRIQKDVHR